MIFQNIWWVILILQLSPPQSKPIHLETSVLLFYFCVFLWQDIKSENDNMLNEWAHRILGCTRTAGLYFCFWRDNRTLNGRDHEEIKRKSNEPSSLLLLTHTESLQVCKGGDWKAVGDFWKMKNSTVRKGPNKTWRVGALLKNRAAPVKSY